MVYSKKDKMRDEIVHELEVLGQEIKPHLLQEPKPFEITESSIQTLRHELHDRDHEYRKEVQGLRKDISKLSMSLLKEEAVIRDYKNENESLRRLLGQVVKLVGRRIGNGMNAVLRFLRLKRKKQQ